MAKFDSRVEDWADLADEAWPVLFFGNGTSMNIWEGFGYKRLRDKAALGPPALSVFQEMNTSNFEAVLEAVMHAQTVASALGRGTRRITDLYEEIQQGLFEAVRQVHVPHALIPLKTLHAFGQALDDCSAAFTTNYDLLPYWALMETPHVRIADFLWSPGTSFDPADATLHSGWTGLYFLHGGVHLWQDDRTGITGKWTSNGAGLLRLTSQFGRSATRRPLFVSEGAGAAKRRTIRRSDYLSFALDELRSEARNTVVIGSALGSPDAHIVEALQAGARRSIALAVRPSATANRVVAFKADMAETFKGHYLRFFNSETHPLGDPALQIAYP